MAQQASQAPQELPDPYKLTIRGELGDKLSQALCTRVSDTVAACHDRDSDLRMYRDQLEAVSNPISNDPWPGAAILESLLSREFHTTLLSTIFSAARQTPYVVLEPETEGDETDASTSEVYLNTKMKKYGYEKCLYDKIYTALESRFAATCIEACQEVKKYFQLQAKTPQGIVDPSAVLDDTPSDEQIVLVEEPQPVRIKYRNVDSWDFYLFPPEASNPQYCDGQGAIAVIERMWLTEEDLLMGVRNKGYDKEQVAELIRQGPTSLQGEIGLGREDELNRDGISLTTPTGSRGSGYWECYQVIGRAPYLPGDDGMPSIPDTLLHADCLWMVCPQRNIVFKQAYSPYPDGIRPYTITHAYEKPGRLEGEGIVSLLTPLHDEHTATQRFYINNMNLEATPSLTVPEAYLTKYAKWKMAPGRFLPRLPGDDVGPKPLVWDIGSQQLIMPMMDRLEAQASRIAASESVNAGLTPQPLKAAQVQFSDAMQQLKFDLILSNIQRGVKADAEITMKLLIQHFENIEAPVVAPQAMDAQGQPQTPEVNADILSKPYEFIPQANSQNASPMQRQQKMQNIAMIVQQWWQWQAQLPPQNLNAAWHLSQRLLMTAGEPNPEQYLGPEPPTADEIAMMQQQMMMEQQQQMEQAQMMGGGGGGMPPEGGSAQPPVNITNNVTGLNGFAPQLAGAGAGGF